MGTSAQLPPGHEAEFILAGCATFTVVSQKTGTRYTFRVEKAEPKEETGVASCSERWFVKVLTGMNNEEDYTYCGMIDETSNFLYRFHRTKATRYTDDSGPMVAFTWVSRVLNGLPIPNTEIWLEGKCGRCGRKLTVPSSIELGYGPECAGLALGK